MFDIEADKKIRELSKVYEQTWGKDPDFQFMLGHITQTDLVTVLERIIDTGESGLVGWEHIFLHK